MRGRGFRQRPSTYKISAAPQGAIRSPGQLLHRIRDSGKVSASALFRPQRRARGGRGGSRGGKKRHQRKQKQKAKKTRQGAGTKKGQKKKSRHKARASGGEETVDEVEPRPEPRRVVEEGQADGTAPPGNDGRRNVRRGVVVVL